MKRLLLALTFSACSLLTMAQTGSWTQIKDIDSTPTAPVGRIDAVGLAIGTKGFVGLGVNSTHNPGVLLRDFEAYDPTTDNWSVAPLFGGVSRASAVAFGIGR